MSAKAIREYHGKRLVSKWISEYGDYDIENRCVQVGFQSVCWTRLCTCDLPGAVSVLFADLVRFHLFFGVAGGLSVTVMCHKACVLPRWLVS